MRDEPRGRLCWRFQKTAMSRNLYLSLWCSSILSCVGLPLTISLASGCASNVMVSPLCVTVACSERMLEKKKRSVEIRAVNTELRVPPPPSFHLALLHLKDDSADSKTVDNTVNKPLLLQGFSQLVVMFKSVMKS